MKLAAWVKVVLTSWYRGFYALILLSETTVECKIEIKFI